MRESPYASMMAGMYSLTLKSSLSQAKKEVTLYIVSQSAALVPVIARLIRMALLVVSSSFRGNVRRPYHIMVLKYFSSVSSPS